MNKNHQRAFLRILVLALLFTALGTLILWDYYKVNRDFLELKTLLRDTRYRAIAKNELLAARFIGKQVVITAMKSGEVIKTLMLIEKRIITEAEFVLKLKQIQHQCEARRAVKG